MAWASIQHPTYSMSSRCDKTKAILRGFEFYVLFMYAGQPHFDRIGILVVIQRRPRDDADSFFCIH
jgi:hypothetical protein